MALSRIHIDSVRNLHQVKLEDVGIANVFFGANGSGKTSILEAIHLLGMARSFRGNSVKSLITHEKASCTVFGEVHGGLSSSVPLGVQRGRDGAAQIKVSGELVKTVAELVEYLPIQVINASSFDLLTGSPSARRQYLDWGVFHVEHRFFGQWQRFQRCIKQRNKLLRHGKISDREIAVWSKELAEAGQAIDAYRAEYFARLNPLFLEIMTQLIPSLDSLELRYRRGWDRNSSYDEALSASLNADCEQGYTHVGPQRADMRVVSGGHVAADVLSRGQQKLVVCGLKLAQGQLLSNQQGRKCTYLVDDLPSELDRQHCTRVCNLLAAMGSQVFITCVEQRDIESVWPQAPQLSMFHVEHGKIEAVN
jgi:DNA replication and repair protein RecF